MRLAREGARVALTYRSDRKEAEEIVDAIETISGEASAEAVDIVDYNAVSDFVKRVVARWGRLDIFVNTVGAKDRATLFDMTPEQFSHVVDVNLKGTFLCCQAVIPVMARQGKGSIVNISALAAHYRATMAGVQYTAAKAGVEGLTRQLAYDFGPQGIRVNAVAPTVTMTGERTRGLWEAKSESEREKVVANIPLRRLSTPQEVAAAVVFLASDDASYITGITLDVVGGRYLR